MATVTLTEETFEPTIRRDGIVLVDFWAEWCGPCRRFAPVYEAASVAHPEAVFAKLDTEAEQGIAAEHGITSIPTLMIFRDGILLYAEPGALPAPALRDLVTKAAALDMAEVRRTVEARQSEKG